MLDMPKFAIFEVKEAANGFDVGWYFRLTESLYNEPVGPFATEEQAREAATTIPGMYR